MRTNLPLYILNNDNFKMKIFMEREIWKRKKRRRKKKEELGFFRFVVLYYVVSKS